jgi:hypothetical protein
MDRKTRKRGAHGATRLPTGQQIHKLKSNNTMFEHAF